MKPKARVQPRVGVVIATFNSSRYIDVQLQSIDSQSTPVDEIVFTDDGSTDKTRAIVEDFGRGRRDVSLAPWQAAGGVVSNFERGLRLSTADVIFLCDHDDAWEADKVSDLTAELDATSRSMIFTDATLIDSVGTATGETLFQRLLVSPKERELVTQGDSLRVLVKRNIVTGATAAITRPLLELALPFPKHWIHDEWLAAIAATVGELKLYDKPLTRYRVHNSNLIGVSSSQPRARIKRMLASSPSRHKTSLQRFEELAMRARLLGASAESLTLIEAKVAFESARSEFPASRIKRIPRLIALLPQYRNFSSQGTIDVLRDLLVR